MGNSQSTGDNRSTAGSQSILSVSEVNIFIKAWMDGQPTLSRILVRGEISNYRKYPSGHHYFTLKDAAGVLKCVIFRSEAKEGLRFTPEDGMTVIAGGRISVFPRDGCYQLYCRSLTPDGIGALTVAFEQLKARLHGQGLFDESHKKPLPQFPRTVALVTSPAGAAVRDMIRIMGNRWPMCRVLVAPVRVQGDEAPGEICAALETLNTHRLCDAIVVGRGGGSIEDLWAFNDEGVARAIFASRIPVVSAVGHEPDVTISDFVADARAATPSHAAEMLTPDQEEWKANISRCGARLSQCVHALLNTKRDRLRVLSKSHVLSGAGAYLQDRRLLLDLTQQRLAVAALSLFGGKKQRFAMLTGKLDALSPLTVLSRGYCLATRHDGTVLRDAGQAAPGDRLTLRLARGRIHCVVDEQ